jgi:hypothetical protein
MSNVLYTIEDKVCDELKELGKKPDWSQSDVELAYKLMDIYKDALTSEAMKEELYSNNSMDNRMRSMNNYRSYDDDYSYRRGRDSMGRYTSRDDGYSGHDTSMVEKLRTMMRDATSEKERSNYQSLIDHLER